MTRFSSLTPGGGTALYDAVHAGVVLGGGHESRSVVLVFTDGTDTASFLTKESVLDSARRGDVVVYAAVEGRRSSFLADVTETTGGSVTSVGSANDLPSLFVRLLDEFRQRYLIGYSPRGVEPAGGTASMCRSRATDMTSRPGRGTRHVSRG